MAATTVKANRMPLHSIQSTNSAGVGVGVVAAHGAGGSSPEDNMSVEQYLEMHLNTIIKDFKQHTQGLISKLQDEYQEGARSINSLTNKNKSEEKRICVILKVVAGPHIGQRFRLEPAGEDTEDVFKMGRSTGKQFKEKGVSLYKDKEISTTHAKIEIRNGQAFLIDASSTNGTLLNNEEVEPITPLRLKDADVITVGSTEMSVHIAVIEGENTNC